MEKVGIISVASEQNASQTAAKFVAAAKKVGLTIYGQRDYSQGMQESDGKRSTILILFGNPKLVANLIAADQKICLDLPMRALVWEGPDGQTHISYNDPRWMISRYGLGVRFGDVASKMASVIEKLTNAACSVRAES